MVPASEYKPLLETAASMQVSFDSVVGLFWQCNRSLYLLWASEYKPLLETAASMQVRVCVCVCVCVFIYMGGCEADSSEHAGNKAAQNQKSPILCIYKGTETAASMQEIQIKKCRGH